LSYGQLGHIGTLRHAGRTSSSVQRS